MHYRTELVYENREVIKGIYKLSVQGSFSAQPGQFYMLKTPAASPLLPRPISVHNLENGILSFLYAVVGKGTEQFSRLRPGDTVTLLGALGNGFNPNHIQGKVAIVTGGLGIAPMYYLAKQLQHTSIDLYAGFRDDIYGLEDCMPYINNLYVSTESGKFGKKGYVTESFSPSLYDIVLCCGPEPMMKKVLELCEASNVPAYISMERHMACGVGACLVCTCKTKTGSARTCKDGPVFSSEDVIFDA